MSGRLQVPEKVFSAGITITFISVSLSFQKDKRYLVMKENSSERDKIVDDYIDKLAKAGPPPPPTQQEGRR